MPTINKITKKQPEKTDNQKERAKFYSSVKWLKLRQLKLQNNPVCERCLDYERVSFATQVHHQTPFIQGKTDGEKWALFLDYDQLQSLCAKCHGELHGGKTF